jgi:integrase
MILLGVNCGLGNADCGSLPIKAVDLDNAWLTFPRVKTGIKRRSKLWPETVLAIREYLKVRREPNDQENAGLLFVTTYGNPWHVDGSKGRPITAEFRKLLGKLNLYREGLSFYSLRHCVQTLGDELTGDFLAVTHVMGHADSSISDHYRERMHDGRLVAVSDAIRGWLFGSEVVKS